jgi:nitroimidazol reductase NimA-like FMN-containing flavoprotein (pyridoxamine 5'-phosphate oxidase superfamily)
MSRTADHEIVSIYPFSDEEVDQLMNNSSECVLMWSTKDGWPVGVIHAYVWHDGKIWMTFAVHRHRTAAIKRDNRVSVTVSSSAYPRGAAEDLPTGAITFKGRGEIFDDEKTKEWFYRALSQKLNPNNESGEEYFYNFLDSPLRIVLSVSPEKMIQYSAGKAGRHMAGTIDESELGERKSADAERMNKEREARGLPPR